MPMIGQYELSSFPDNDNDSAANNIRRTYKRPNQPKKMNDQKYEA